MRYSDDHKRRARDKLLVHGGRHAKEHGFAASGVDSLAAAAGVTTGSLYKHFDGKTGLFAAIIASELGRTAEMFSQIASDDAQGIARVMSGYLSTKHVEHPEQGCPLPALTAEVARAPEAVRAAFEEGLLAVKAQIARLAGSDEAAWTLIAQSVGAVMIARAMCGNQTRRDLLHAVRDHAQALLAQLPPARTDQTGR